VYDYSPEGKVIWEGLSTLFPLAAIQPTASEVAKRLLHIQSLETVHTIDEGVASDPLEIDAAAVLGWSYPSWRGGVLGHIDDVGPAQFLEECETLAARYGKRFEVPASLRERAKSGSKFHASGETV
jgi:3-hydroxyacyl-CoA dehydrogenase/enoyl-CoA hydratase/3-hydroxybutyryl-CoA epimerase